MSGGTADRAERPISFTAPFRHPAFTVIWTATLVSNVGGWMYNAASGWLMTLLDADPLMVALVQAASSLPICLFAIPAGALADIFDKRRFLIVVEIITTIVSAVYALVVGLGWATPANLLVFTFLIGAAGAMTVPAWQAVVTYLVPRDDLPPAIAANSVGVNISRAIGPALGGVTIAAYGIVAPFWINAASNLGIVASLLWWRPRTRAGTLLPAERFGQAILAGLRYARHNRHLRATLTRAAGFFPFASAYWALYTTVFFGCLTLGSAAWGEVAVLVGIANAHFLAAAGAIAAIVLTWRWKLQTGTGIDLSPSMHWPAPLTAEPIENDRGPVLVTVEYRIDPRDREPFLEALAQLEHERRRDGAYAWGVFEDAAQEGRILETFLIESWMEHLRQHERVTKADRLLQEEIRRFDRSGNPKVTHFIAADM